MKENRKRQLNSFFTRYSELFGQMLDRNGDVGDIMDMYAVCIIGSNPTGVMCGNNDGTFRKSISGGYDFYRQIGVTGMYVASQKHTLLDEHHAISKIGWKCKFAKKDGSSGSIEFDNYYLTRTGDSRPQIFGWITGDEQSVLKEQDLI